MNKPVRLQLSRQKGFDLQMLSRQTNDLPAVNVARPTKWGNPYRASEQQDAASAVEMYRNLLTRPASRIRHMILRIASDGRGRGEGAILEMKLSLPELRGKNLACWCKLGEPCHADVLLELANAPTCNEVHG